MAEPTSSLIHVTQELHDGFRDLLVQLPGNSVAEFLASVPLNGYLVIGNKNLADVYTKSFDGLEKS